ncbi:SDR family NAD(P)-dependent oxidoreductase [Subtercola sp. YIM 133946]|uniref:SDR family NAD(P)-dependent oxidoreductase n=1 Tax=Subtercola sp. YIM 133946 TaxID=3118909 RepID=UPI002F94C282
MDLDLRGRRAIVSGGSKGIGLAIAEALAAEGAQVAISARGDEVEETAARIAAESGSRVIGVRADTTDDASVRAMVETVVERLGGVDILVNTAATPWSASKNVTTLETTDDLMRGEFETKVLGYLRTARAAAPHMVEAGWGRIINISGLGARQASTAAQTVRNVSVSAITKNLADELGPKGVNVTVVHPGVTRTARLTDRLAAQSAEQGVSVDALEEALATNSIRRLIDASEVADVVVFLASPRSVAITGDAIAVGGGVPGPVYY